VTPLVELFRARGAGALRTDLSTGTLLDLYTALLEGVIGKGLPPRARRRAGRGGVTSVSSPARAPGS